MTNLSNIDMRWNDFVVHFFQRIGAQSEPWEPDEGVAGVRVELTQEQVRSVEGRPPPLFGWNWGGPPPNEVTTWYLTLEDRGAATETTDVSPQPDEKPREQLCVPGSFRGRQLIDAALRLWPVGRTFLGTPPSTAGLPVSGAMHDGASEAESLWSWRPHLVFHLLLLYVAGNMQRAGKTVAVDLVTGHVIDYSDFGNAVPITDPSAIQKHVSQTPRLTVGDAHDAAMEHVRTTLVAAGDDWAAQHHAWVTAESEQLQAFVRRAELEEGSEALANLRSARFAELQRLRPHVRVEIAAATIVYLLTSVPEHR